MSGWQTITFQKGKQSMGSIAEENKLFAEIKIKNPDLIDDEGVNGEDYLRTR